jgi:hypothetical protein
LIENWENWIEEKNKVRVKKIFSFSKAKEEELKQIKYFLRDLCLTNKRLEEELRQMNQNYLKAFEYLR